MDVVVFVESIIDVQHQLETSSNEDSQVPPVCNDSNNDKIISENTEKHSAVWTSSATAILLKLYESKLEMLETPKRKRRIWLAISESLKDHNINMSPDQVRWKINALTKKYKRCVNTGAHERFKYFKEMSQIYSKYNIDSYGYTISEILDRRNNVHKNFDNANVLKRSESKSVIELRKIRLANRIESDRSQVKIHLERQWLEYLNRQEQGKMQRDELMDRIIKLKEQELELLKTDLEGTQSMELKNLQLTEKDLKETLGVEKEKCDLLKQLFS